MRISDWSSDVCSSDLATPGAFQLLELLVMQNQVDLFRKLVVYLGNDRLDGLISVGRHGYRMLQRLLGQCFDGMFYGFYCLIRLRLEFLLQQGRQTIGLFKV